MTNRTLLVALREFRQIALTRGFWFTLLIVPVALVLQPFASRLISKSSTQTVMLIDQGGGSTASAIRDRLAMDQARKELDALSRYVHKNQLEQSNPNAIWAKGDHWHSDAEVDQFLTEGGVEEARVDLAQISAKKAENFTAPEPEYELVSSADNGHISLGEIESLVRPPRPNGRSVAPKPIDDVVLIPRDFDTTGRVTIWTASTPDADFLSKVRSVLVEVLNGRQRAAAIAVQRGEQSVPAQPTFSVVGPPEGSGSSQILIKSILPLACAYVLMMSLMLSGSWMLQGTVEERSNKLLESLLACITPNELMFGKLIGTLAVGLSMILTWAACGLFVAYATDGAFADLTRSALEPVSSITSIAAIVYFFLSGYLMVSMLFLVIGVISDSMSDAQAYLTPVILAIMLPFSLLAQAIARGVGGIGVELLTWFPIYTPFAVLARLGSGIRLWEMVGAGIVLGLFIAVELWLLGRVFRASLLGGGRLSLRSIFGSMRGN